VIFGVAANVSISKLFLAGIVPGHLLGVALWVTWWWLVRASRWPRRRASPLPEVLAGPARRHLGAGLPVIIVGLKFGVFTPPRRPWWPPCMPCCLHGGVPRAELASWYRLFLAAAKTTSVVMFLVAAAMVSAWLITVASCPQDHRHAAAVHGQPAPADGRPSWCW
jgi:TRAP-type C4-dicarboxylate transport system permease large subunit